MTAPLFVMDADSLLSKWGFGDGDGLIDWWWENFDVTLQTDTHELLYNLVVLYLVPKIKSAGHDIEIYRIHTNHNPVRASTVNGVEVDVTSYRTVTDLEGIEVSLTREEIESVMNAVVLKESAPK